jgi:hypothetical protein
MIIPILLIVVPSHTNASQALSDGLVGYWKFDETSGTTAVDSSGHGNNGTLTNGATISTDLPTTSFPNPRSLSFDGTNDFVDTGTDIEVFDLTDNFTVSAWVKHNLNSVTYPQGVLTNVQNTGCQGGYIISINNGNLPNVRICNGSTIDDVTASAPIDTEWHHLLFTVQSGTTRLFVDGSVQSDTSTQALSGNTQPLQIGRFYPGWDNFYFSGLIDDVRIYNRALSATEIADLAAGRHTQAAWKGSVSAAFENAGNWSGSVIPDPFARVSIPFRTNPPDPSPLDNLLSLS